MLSSTPDSRFCLGSQPCSHSQLPCRESKPRNSRVAFLIGDLQTAPSEVDSVTKRAELLWAVLLDQKDFKRYGPPKKFKWLAHNGLLIRFDVSNRKAGFIQQENHRVAWTCRKLVGGCFLFNIVGSKPHWVPWSPSTQQRLPQTGFQPGLSISFERIKHVYIHFTFDNSSCNIKSDHKYYNITHICISIQLSFYLSIYLPICLSTYLSI